MKHIIIHTVKQGKCVAMIVIGFTILAIGIAMIVLPGPAIVVIPVGLALLATEFIWAKKLLLVVKTRIDRMRKGN